jgi:hypothetical protein
MNIRLFLQYTIELLCIQVGGTYYLKTKQWLLLKQKQISTPPNILSSFEKNTLKFPFKI